LFLQVAGFFRNRLKPDATARRIPTLRGSRPSNALEEPFMKTLVLTASLLSLAMPVAPIEPQQSLDGTWRARLQDAWGREDGQQWVSIQLAQGRDRQSGFSVPITELEGLGARGSRWTATNIQFSIGRDAGSIDFQGDFTDGRGAGTWRFTPNDAFVAELRKTHGDLSLEQVFRLAVHDVSRAFIASMRAEGYPQAALDDLTRMRIHGVDARYVQGLRQAGYDRLTVGELVKTRIHGATPAFVQEVKAAGYEKLPIEALVRMRIHGVTPELIRELRDLGYRDLDVDDLVKLRIHGASTAFIREIRDLGYKDLPVRDLVRMRIHGVTAQFVKELRDLGYMNVSADDLVRMRIHGVTPEFIRDVKAAGFKNMTPDDLVDFSIHGRRWLKKRA
jgi:hypothetical protein